MGGPRGEVDEAERAGDRRHGDGQTAQQRRRRARGREHQEGERRAQRDPLAAAQVAGSTGVRSCWSAGGPVTSAPASPAAASAGAARGPRGGAREPAGPVRLAYRTPKVSRSWATRGPGPTRDRRQPSARPTPPGHVVMTTVKAPSTLSPKWRTRMRRRRPTTTPGRQRRGEQPGQARRGQRAEDDDGGPEHEDRDPGADDGARPATEAPKKVTALGRGSVGRR